MGLDNYKTLIDDEKFAQALSNTALYTVIGVPLQIILGLGLALMLGRVRAFRGISLLGTVLRTLCHAHCGGGLGMAVGLQPAIWSGEYSLGWLHLPPQSFLTSPD